MICRLLCPKLVTLGLLTVLTGVLALAGCHRNVPPELPYDQQNSELLREDLDQFAESG